jgi:heme exporter protein B
METKPSSLLRRALAVLQKDMQVEFRCRYAYSAQVVFAVTTLIAVSFSMGGRLADPDVAASMLWVILFFSSMTGLSRSFAQEEETGTILALRLAADPEPVLLGKYLFNAALLLSLTALIVPLFLVLAGVTVAHPLGFLAIVFLGALGLVGGGTIIAAIAARAAVKGALMTVLSFPIVIPLLISAINGTRLTLGGEAARGVLPDLWFLFFYNGIIVAASFLLFEHIWD